MIRDEEKDARSQEAGVLNFRLRGTTMLYEELLTALENMTTRQEKVDTGAPIVIGMATHSGRFTRKK